MYLKMTQKKPGLNNDQVQAELDLTYKQRFENTSLPDAYPFTQIVNIIYRMYYSIIKNKILRLNNVNMVFFDK